MMLRKLFQPILRSNQNYVCVMSVCGIKNHVSHMLIELNRRKKNLEFGKQPKPPVARSSYLEWNYDAELYSFSKRIGEDIDSVLLVQSLTTRSYIIQEEEKQKAVGITDPVVNTTDNNTLVDNGTDFMGQYIKQYLRIALPYFPEEGIQSLHNYLTSEEVLSHIAKNIGMGDIVQTAEHPPENSTLQSCLIALIEAIRLSNDDQRAGNFIRDIIITQLVGKNVNEIWKIENAVEKLNNIYKNEGEEIPEPRLVGSVGKNTIMACYRVAFYNKAKQMIGLGAGESVEIAKEMAALDALARLFRTTERDSPIKYDIEIEEVLKQISNPSIEEWSQKKLAHASG